MVLLAVAAFATWKFWPRPAVIDSIAILPFANESKDSTMDFLGEGVTEELIDRLAEIPGLRVASHNSVFQLRDTKLDTREIAQRLRVQAILIGRVRADGDTYRVSTELVDGRDDRHLWGQEYTFAAGQLRYFQGMLARELAETLRLKLDHDALAKLEEHATHNPAAYEAYLRGRFAQRTRNRESLQHAITYYQQAIDLDPNFALAYAGLAASYAIGSYQGVMPPATAMPLADAAAQRSVELAPDRAQTHVQIAYQLANWHRNLPAAIKEAERALQIDPNLADAHHAYGEFLHRSGRIEEALEQRRIGMLLDPEWPLAHSYYMTTLLALGRYSEVEDMAKGPYANSVLAMVRVLQGRYKEAAELFPPPGPMPPVQVPYRAAAWARGGRPQDARTLLQMLLDQRAKSYASAYHIGTVYYFLGDSDRAFQWFNTAIDEYDLAIVFAGTDRILDSLHSDPRWANLMQRLNTPK